MLITVGAFGTSFWSTSRSRCTHIRQISTRRRTVIESLIPDGFRRSSRTGGPSWSRLLTGHGRLGAPGSSLFDWCRSKRRTSRSYVARTTGIRRSQLLHARRRSSFVSTSVAVIVFSVLSVVVAVVLIVRLSLVLPALLPVIVVLPLALGAAGAPAISLVVRPIAAGVVVAANSFVPVVASS